MLAFLESLSRALMERDVDVIRHLLDHPLARTLPRHVRDEARAIANGTARAFVVPLQTLHLYHQTAHLLGACADPGVRTFPPAQGSVPVVPSTLRSQMELALEPVTAG